MHEWAHTVSEYYRCTETADQWSCHGHVAFSSSFSLSTSSGFGPESVGDWPGWHRQGPRRAGPFFRGTPAPCVGNQSAVAARGIHSECPHTIEGFPAQSQTKAATYRVERNAARTQ